MHEEIPWFSKMQDALWGSQTISPKSVSKVGSNADWEGKRTKTSSQLSRKEKQPLGFASPNGFQTLVVGLWPTGGPFAIALFSSEHSLFAGASWLQSVPQGNDAHDRTHKPTLTSGGTTSYPFLGCTGSHTRQDQIRMVMKEEKILFH